MQWKQENSLFLSRVCIAFFALVLLASDLGGWYVLPLFLKRLSIVGFEVPVLVMLYAFSVPAWIALAGLWRLIASLSRQEIFTQDNIRRLRVISWCCFGAAAIALGGALWFSAVLCVLAAACALMGLIVRIVRNIFGQAALMKDELDLTV